MNRRLFGALIVMAMAMGLAVNAGAQQRARADVPFDFVVGDKVLSAATYDISSVAANALVIRARDGKSALFQIQPADAKYSMQAMLVFHKYGDRYFLYQIWDADRHGIQLRESKLEREQKLASNSNVVPQEVVLALR